ncbi:hypothetical protein [Taibaiella soli]|uniref:Uncharacterized protein n=1 Tax=Taibaiella soli TaxID=1649169 RepID=A0A2W2AXV1_9BACT|nr:hypothetical protein [Taibaiella soli]PZF72844.1 hypothetical protein DN068_10545 [Taibaiella soli]
MSDWKAILSLIVLEIWFFFTLLGYYVAIVNPQNSESVLGGVWTYSILVVILCVKYFAFGRSDVSRKYVHEFEQWPKRKNRIGGIIVWASILMIAANLVFVIYLFYQT